MDCLHIYSDANAQSRFGTIAVPQVDAGGDAMLVRTSGTFSAAGLRIVTAPPGEHDLGWHNAPSRVLCVVLLGSVDFEIRSIGVKRLGLGEMALIEDTEGPGHTARHPDGVTVALVPVPDGFDAPSETPEAHAPPLERDASSLRALDRAGRRSIAGVMAQSVADVQLRRPDRSMGPRVAHARAHLAGAVDALRDEFRKRVMQRA